MATDKDLAEYFDVLHESKDYAKEVSFFETLFSKFSKKRKVERILLVGCGTGGHVSLLSANRSLICLDSSSECLDLAKSRYAGVDFFPETLSHFSLDRKFDAVICPFSTFNLQTREEDVRGFLSSCAAHLEKGGLFIFDYMAPHEKGELTLDVSSSGKVDVACLTQWVPSDFTVSARRSYWVKDGKKNDFFVTALSYLRFPVKKIVPVIKKAGFKHVRFFEGFSLKSYSSAPVAVFVAVKK